MTDFVTYQGKIAGIALLLSLLSLAVGLIIVAAQGKVYGLAAGFRGVEGIAPDCHPAGVLRDLLILSNSGKDWGDEELP